MTKKNEQCPDCPPNQVGIVFSFRRVLMTFLLAEHAGRFYACGIVQCPLTGYGDSFRGAPACGSMQEAFDLARQKASEFIAEHGKEAVAQFAAWRPDIPAK